MSEQVTVKVDTTAVEAMFAKSPVAVYYAIRRFLFGALLAHRIYWLRQKGTKFGRGSGETKAIKVWRVNEAPQGRTEPNWVTFTVSPPERRRDYPNQAERGLREMQAVTGTGSIVLKVHQQGGVTTSPKWMAIPIRTRPGTPEAWRKANPGKVLIAIKDKSKADRLWLVERIRKLRKGRKPPKGARRKRVFEKLRKRFMLTHRVVNKPTLKFYESWDQLTSARTKEWDECATLILQEITGGNPT